jgi:hypothetical protein
MSSSYTSSLFSYCDASDCDLSSWFRGVSTSNNGLKQVGVLGDESDGGSTALPLDWSQWLNEFLSRLFTLLVHLEPSSQS